MLREIGRLLSSWGFSSGFAFILWILMFDEKAIERLRKKPIRYFVYVGIIIHVCLLTVEIVKVVINHIN